MDETGSAARIIPDPGEIFGCIDQYGAPISRFKVGDGCTALIDLPYCSFDDIMIKAYLCEHWLSDDVKEISESSLDAVLGM